MPCFVSSRVGAVCGEKGLYVRDSGEDNTVMTTKLQAHHSVRAVELREISQTLLALAELAPERMTLAQASFFLLAASADVAGKPTTFTEVRDRAGPQLNRTLHNTYKVYMTEGRLRDGKREVGLGWLTSDKNPDDNRQKFLRLTERGREVLNDIIIAVSRKSQV